MSHLKKHIVLDLSILNRRQHTGLERYSLNVAQALLKRKNFRYSYINCPEIRLPELKSATKIPVEISNNHTPEALRELAFWADDARADILLGTFYPVPERKSFKTILTIHDLIPLRLDQKAFSMYSFYNDAIRQSAQHADAIVAVSQSTKRDIIELFGTPAARIHVVCEAADERFCVKKNDPLWPKLQAKYKLHKPYLLAVCTTSPHKNLNRILEAFTIVKSKPFAKDLQLVLVGMAGSSDQDLAKRISSHPNTKDILRTGYFPDNLLPSLYRHARAFVWPSLYEGFGLPLLEAMQCGTPVITSTLSSIPEIVGDTAFSCDALSSESIAEAINLALTNEPLREKKITSALQRAKLFSWDKAAAQIEKIWRSC